MKKFVFKLCSYFQEIRKVSKWNLTFSKTVFDEKSCSYLPLNIDIIQQIIGLLQHSSSFKENCCHCQVFLKTSD